MDTKPGGASLHPGDENTHNEAKTRELAEAYVCGRLSPADSDAFEEHFFACAECWDDVQALQKFRDGVSDAARTGQLAAAPPVTHWKWAFAVAAVALAGFASWTMLVQIPRLEMQLAAARNVPVVSPMRVEAPVVLAQANLPLLMLEASRADTATALSVPAAAKQIAIWIDVPRGMGPFVLLIKDKEGRTVETLSGLTPNSHGALTAAVPMEKLAAGGYTARLMGGEGALAGEYKFEIKR